MVGVESPLLLKLVPQSCDGILFFLSLLFLVLYAVVQDLPDHETVQADLNNPAQNELEGLMLSHIQGTLSRK